MDGLRERATIFAFYGGGYRCTPSVEAALE
jgi:hypothetical protein